MNNFLQLIKNRFDRNYAVGLTAIFLLIGTITALHHEMWRDEIQSWLIARDSTSLIDLYRNLKYEGHPGSWHLYLLILSRFTVSPWIMQVFHLLIATTTVYLFARYSPFTYVQKFLFSFGYFSLYEYAILCRNYAPGVLFICLFCVLYQRRYVKFIWVSMVLFLLAHTTVHALILAIVISLALLGEFFFNRKRILAEKAINKWHIIIGFSLIGVGLLTSIPQVIPPLDNDFALATYTSYDPNRFANVIKIITYAFFPVPEATLHFWGSRWLEQFPFYTKTQIVLSCFLMIWFSLILFRKPIVWLTFVFGTVGLLILFYTKYYGSIRHHGFIFLLFIMSGWIYQYCKVSKWPALIDRFGVIWQKSYSPLLTFILIFHLIGGIIAVSMDYRYVFSNGKTTADFIKAEGMQKMLMVGEKDSAVSTVVGYLEKDLIYYPRSHRYGSYIIWDQKRSRSASDDQIIRSAKKIGGEHKQDVLIVLNRMLEPNIILQNSIKELESFTGSIVGSEDFHLYLISPE